MERRFYKIIMIYADKLKQEAEKKKKELEAKAKQEADKAKKEAEKKAKEEAEKKLKGLFK